ncbi:putative 5-oxoprolinase isoform X1 [Sesbania bispinosa]|nr:putative 5-oxoprolinase isoform X1 [Sesbania bispinosa]
MAAAALHLSHRTTQHRPGNATTAQFHRPRPSILRLRQRHGRSRSFSSIARGRTSSLSFFASGSAASVLASPHPLKSRLLHLRYALAVTFTSTFVYVTPC